MKWSLLLARVAGIEVKIHLTFLLLLAWIGYSAYGSGGSAAALGSVVFVLALFGCVLLHEFGHAFAARRYGIRTPDITLYPIGGVARMERIPENPAEELVIAVAGPLVNVAIAAGLFVVLLIQGAPLPTFRSFIPFMSAGLGSTGFWQSLLSLNVLLVLFNLIPAFPMDGGRVLRALLAMRLPYPRATQLAANVGQGIAFLFGLFGLFGGQPMLLFIAFFVYIGATQEAAQAQMRSVSTGLPVSSAMVTQFAILPADATLGDAVEALLATSQHEFPVVSADGRVLGILTRNQMIRSLRDQPDAARPVGEIMQRDVPSVLPDVPFESAFAQMQAAKFPALPVVNRAGTLVGLLTPENVGELLMVQAVLPKGRALPLPAPRG